MAESGIPLRRFFMKIIYFQIVLICYTQKLDTAVPA